MKVFLSFFLNFMIFTTSIYANDPFTQNIQAKVTAIIQNADTVPGLKSEEFKSIQAGLIERWNELVAKGVLEVTATDKETRPYFVALQGIVEHVLSHELKTGIKSLKGVIHTPMPATPLCTKGEISKELVDPSIVNDPLRLFTVNARTTIIRDYLFQGGDLYIVYPKEGLAKRTPAQQEIYKAELANYPTHLFDSPLEIDSLESDLIGAYYLFTTHEGKSFAFAIKMTQANDPQDMGSFGLWFGEMQNSPVQERILHVSNTLHLE